MNAVRKFCYWMSHARYNQVGILQHILANISFESLIEQTACSQSSQWYLHLLIYTSTLLLLVSTHHLQGPGWNSCRNHLCIVCLAQNSYSILKNVYVNVWIHVKSLMTLLKIHVSTVWKFRPVQFLMGASFGFIVLVTKLSVSGMFQVEVQVQALITIMHRRRQSVRSGRPVWRRAPVGSGYCQCSSLF